MVVNVGGSERMKLNGWFRLTERRWVVIFLPHLLGGVTVLYVRPLFLYVCEYLIVGSLICYLTLELMITLSFFVEVSP